MQETMQTSPDANLPSALDRLKNGQASSEDLDLIAQAVALGQIRIIPSGDSKTIMQSGGVNYGESNEIHISGPVIGSLNISEISSDQVELILQRLEIQLSEKASSGQNKTEQSEEHKRINWTPYIVAMFGLLGALVLAYATLVAPRLATQTEIRATQEKEATLTYMAISLLPSITVSPSILTTPTPLPSPYTETPAPTHTITFTPTPACPYAGDTDDETIRALIVNEAEAVNREAIDIILAIFSADAFFADYAVPSGQPPRTWFDPLARYQDDLFKNTDIRGASHFGIFPAGPGISGDTAYYVSGSMGSFRSGDEWVPYLNGSIVGEKATTYGSDHWTLRRGSNGCWAIIRHDFNAGHIPFP
jgi:hypothetical protein